MPAAEFLHMPTSCRAAFETFLKSKHKQSHVVIIKIIIVIKLCFQVQYMLSDQVIDVFNVKDYSLPLSTLGSLGALAWVDVLLYSAKK